MLGSVCLLVERVTPSPNVALPEHRPHCLLLFSVFLHLPLDCPQRRRVVGVAARGRWGVGSAAEAGCKEHLSGFLDLGAERVRVQQRNLPPPRCPAGPTPRRAARPPQTCSAASHSSTWMVASSKPGPGPGRRLLWAKPFLSKAKSCAPRWRSGEVEGAGVPGRVSLLPVDMPVCSGVGRPTAGLQVALPTCGFVARWLPRALWLWCVEGSESESRWRVPQPACSSEVPQCSRGSAAPQESEVHALGQ